MTEGDLVVSETTHLINDAERPCEGGQRGALRHKEFEGHKGRSKVEEGGFKGNECQSGADQQDRQFLASPSSSQSPDKISPTLRAFRKQYSSTGGGSESGTEADDELPKKLPAPPSRRRRKWDFESNEEEDGDEGVDSANSGALRDEGDTEIAGGARSWRRRRISIGGKGIREEVYLGITGLGVKGRKILFVQRGIEIGLVVILVESVLMGKRADGEGRLWNVVVEDWIVGKSRV